VLFYNYRGDRPREITKAFVIDDFKGFDRGAKLDLYYATMTEYEAGLPVHVISGKPEALKNILGEVVSKAGIGAVPLRRDGEEPARDLFSSTITAASRSPVRTAPARRARRWRPTTCSPRCRPRR
jgi:hypothetical protein